MSQNILQIFTANPAASMVATDLLYLGRSPYDTTDDFAITFANFVLSIGTATPTASTIPRWDANINLSANNFLPSQNSITSSGGTTVLTVSSAYQQIITGSTTQIVQEAVTSTLAIGYSRLYTNNSTGIVTINSSGGNLIQSLAPNTSMLIACNAITGTTASSWTIIYYNSVSNSTPSLNAANITYTVSAVTDIPEIILNYTSGYVNGVFISNLLTSNIQFGAISNTLSTFDFGNTQYLTTGIIFNTPILTAMNGSFLLGITGSISISAALLTTFTFPLLTIVIGTITIVNANSLITFNLPDLTENAGMTFTSATSLTTLNFASLTNIYGPLTGTLNALTSVSMPSLLSIVGTVTLTSSSLVTLSLPALTSLGSNLSPTMSSLTTLNLPSLISIAGFFTTTLSALTSLTLTNLTTITGLFSLTAATLTTLSLPALTTCSGGFAPVCAAATTVTLTSLATVTGTVAASFAALTTLSMPALLTVTSTFTLTAANLTTFSFNSGLLNIGGNVTMTGMALNQASVDGILVSLANLNGTGGTTSYNSHTVNLSGGTSSTPSATGLAAKATLVGRGCTVTTN